MPKALTKPRAHPPDSTAESATGEPRNTFGPPSNFANKHGLPPIPQLRVKWEQFMEYWRSLPADKRRHITVFVYRLFPKINLPPNEHAIAQLPGEQPLGGESGNPEEALLHNKGLGDYWLQMKYTEGAANQVILITWLWGYRDNLPGFTDFKNHPPAIGTVNEVVLDDEKNIKSGYINYLRTTGQLRGEAQDERTQDMAEQTAGAVAMGIIGDIAKDALKDRRETPPQVVVQAPVPEKDATAVGFGIVKEAVETVHRMNKENKNPPPDPIAMVREFAGMMPPPPDFSPFTMQVTSLTEKLIDMHGQRASDLQDQLKEMRADNRAALDRMAQLATAPRGETPPLAQTDPLADMGKRLLEKKLEAFISGDGGDEPETPRRRRRDLDDDEEPVHKPSMWEEVVRNLPTIVTGLAGLATSVGVALHNARVVQKGEGETTLPPIPDMPAPPYSNPGMPSNARELQAQIQGAAGHPHQPSAQPSVAPQGGGQGNMESFNRFMRMIEAGLVGALERSETGYEYAELFIKAYGRTGEWGYESLKTSHTVKMLNPGGTVFPHGSVYAIANALKMYEPIWSRVGADPRLPLFLEQFVTYDEFLTEYEARNLTEIISMHGGEDGIRTIQEFLDLPEEEDEGEGGGEGTGEEAQAQVVHPMPPASTPATGTAPAPKERKPKTPPTTN